jgi:hypothetical protein
MRFRHLDVVTEGYAFAHRPGFPQDVPVSTFHIKIITPYTVTAGSKNHPTLALVVSSRNAYTGKAGTESGAKSLYALSHPQWSSEADSRWRFRVAETPNASGLKSY